MFSRVTEQEFCTSCTHPLAFHSYLISLWSSPLPSLVPLYDYFHHEREKKKLKTQVFKKKNSLFPNLWVQMCFWPWARFGRTFCSGCWIAVMASLRHILLSLLGCFLLFGFKTMNNSNKYWSEIPSMPTEIRHCMRRGHAEKKNTFLRSWASSAVGWHFHWIKVAFCSD